LDFWVGFAAFPFVFVAIVLALESSDLWFRKDGAGVSILGFGCAVAFNRELAYQVSELTGGRFSWFRLIAPRWFNRNIVNVGVSRGDDHIWFKSMRARQ